MQKNNEEKIVKSQRKGSESGTVSEAEGCGFWVCITDKNQKTVQEFKLL